MIKWFWVSEQKNEDHDSEFTTELAHEGNTDENIGQIALDILETNDAIIIVAPIGGISLDDIDLSLNGSVLTIRSKRKKPYFYESVGMVVRNSECFWWDFVRNIILPENLDFDNIKAQMENNLLVITIEKLRFSSQNIRIDRVEG